MKDFVRMNQGTSRTMTLTLIAATLLANVPMGNAVAAGEYAYCDKAYVPCPRAAGFQFFNRTCYGIIRDPLEFGAGDSYFKCESGMHLSFTDPSTSDQFLKLEERSAMDKRMTLARITSLGTLNVLSKLRRQVVPELTESTLVDLACTEDCGWPGSWTFTGSETYPALGQNCADTPACNWLRPGRSVWTKHPGSRAAIEAVPGQSARMPALDTADDYEYYSDLENRLAVLAGPGALQDAPDSISLHSLACEIPFSTTDEGIQQLLPIGLATDADMSLHSQMVSKLSINPIDDDPTHILLSWAPPHCATRAFYVTVLRDADGSDQNRSRVDFEEACDEALELCQMELELPLCSLVYIQVGAILRGQDAAPDVIQWQTPAPEDPLTPESFFISEISGSVVTLTWESAAAAGPCQPHHEVTVQGHGKVKLKPGATELKADLGTHCEHFNASVMATILGRNSSVRGPIHGVTGPTAPDTVDVLATNSTWSSLQWSDAPEPDSPCVKAKYRVTCRPLPPAAASPSGPPTVSLTSPQSSLNVTGLLPGVGYRCGVCALASLMDTAPSDTALKKPPCGDVRYVDLATNETAPGAPHGLNITATSHDSLSLAWRRPREPNGVILRYNISVTCEPKTFPLCTLDPLCVDRWFTMPLEGNDTDHVTFTVTGLQAARLHHVTVAAATAAGQGPFSFAFSADTRVGVPPPPSHVTVTSQVKSVAGHAEQTSISVSLQPPCPFPGAHSYRLQFEQVDFLAGYQSTVRAALLQPDEIRELYAGQRNITFSVFDGKWTPGFNYMVRIVAHTDDSEIEDMPHAPSEPVSFTMTVPPPGPVQALEVDCSSEPLYPSFRWANPTENAFGIVSYRSQYRCRHPVTGHEASSGGWSICQHSQCPCASSQSRSNQCSACERVCNYPVKRFIFMGERTYYFNCTCEQWVNTGPVMPGSECEVTVQAESKYLQQRGAPAAASCRTPEYVARVTGLELGCDGGSLTASWAVPEPVEVETDAYHVNVHRSRRDSDEQETFVKETFEESQCDDSRCGAEWPGLAGDVTYTVRVAAESVYSTPFVGPVAQASCLSPARVPLPPPEELQKQVEQLSGWNDDLDPSRQYLLRLPRNLYDETSGILRELRVMVFTPDVDSATSQPAPPSGNITQLLEAPTWSQYRANRTGGYQASPPAFVLSNDGAGPAEFVLGGNASCAPVPAASHCNGPLEPDTTYAAQLVFVNGAGFASSRLFTFRTKSVLEAEREMAERKRAEHAESEQPGTDQKTPGQKTETDGGYGTMGRSGLADLPEMEADPADTAGSGETVTPAAASTSGTPDGSSSTTLEPDVGGVSVGTAAGAVGGSLAALAALFLGLFLWRRRRRGNS